MFLAQTGANRRKLNSALYWKEIERNWTRPQVWDLTCHIHTQTNPALGHRGQWSPVDRVFACGALFNVFLTRESGWSLFILYGVTQGVGKEPSVPRLLPSVRALCVPRPTIYISICCFKHIYTNSVCTVAMHVNVYWWSFHSVTMSDRSNFSGCGWPRHDQTTHLYLSCQRWIIRATSPVDTYHSYRKVYYQ